MTTVTCLTNARNMVEQTIVQAPHEQRIVFSSLNYYDDPGDGSPPTPVIVGG
jgi:hypothetical protein